MHKFTIYIILMAMITFCVRYFFFSKHLKFRLNQKLRNILTFTAPAVLSAMWAPIVFGTIGDYQAIIYNPYLIVGVFTIVISFTIKNTLLIVALGIGLFALLQYMF